jgi:uncharacterized membrane protein
MTDDPMSGPTRRAFPWKTVAVAALALNLVLIGGGIGAVAAGARLSPPGVPAPGAGPGGGGAMARGILESVPEAKRGEVRALIGAGLKAAAAERRAAREARVAAFKAAMAEPYDAATVRAAFAQMRAADAAALGKFDESLVQVLGRLTPAERQAAMTELARRAIRGRGGARGDRPGSEHSGPGRMIEPHGPPP